MVKFGLKTYSNLILDLSIPWFGETNKIGTTIYLNKKALKYSVDKFVEKVAYPFGEAFGGYEMSPVFP